jgi:hypothetical protein
MIRIAISRAAFDAIATTMPLGSVAYDAEPNAKGERYVWLAPSVVDGLKAMRGPGERCHSVADEGVSLAPDSTIYFNQQDPRVRACGAK